MRLTHIASWSLMDAYSEDLRKKIVEAVEKRGMKKSEAARLFGVSLSSVKRYVRKFRQGSSLSPGKAPGQSPKIDECASRLLEADLKERPFAKLRQRCEYLIAGCSEVDPGSLAQSNAALKVSPIFPQG